MANDEPEPPRRVTIRKVRRGDEESRAATEFWASLTGEQRVELLWEMALEELGRTTGKLIGPDEHPPLLRTVCRVRRA